MTGVLVVDKPEGPTSHDIVALARRALGERRIGHCGTLDPLATGVLVLAVGPATRLVQYLSADDKTYEATLRFGEVTDSHDRTGAVLTRTAERPPREAVVAALEGFRGRVWQTPPAFSAKKVGGQRAYALARQGADVASRLEPVAVTVYALELVAFDGEEASLRMRVSSGFYVRSLVHDLGQAVGTGAVMTALRRTAAGPFHLGRAVTAAALAHADGAAIEGRLIPPGDLLPDVPALTLDAAAAGRARHGQDLPAPAAWPPTPLARLLDESGRLVGLARPAAKAGFLHPAVILG